MIFENVFTHMKNKYDTNINNDRLCIILEEAHTIMTEWNAIGPSNKNISPVINKVSQIALQGRKYNIGLFIISQRTALVSKSILTQCNTIISFRSYDKTSEDFLGAYINADMLKRLGGLENRHAIVFGKAFNNNNIPLICKIDEVEEIKKTEIEIEKDDFEDDYVPF